MKTFIVCLMLVSGLAFAEEPSITVDQVHTSSPSQPWSAIGPKTLAPGENAFEVFAGYPSISAGFLHGVGSGINVGARVGFVYGVEGMFREAAPGFKIQGLLKLRFLDSGMVSLGMTVEPGFLYYGSFLQGARAGITLPIGFRLGIAASSAFAVAITVDFPMWAEFGTFGGFNLPILTGGGVEYFITSQFVAFARARIGPTIRSLGRQTEVTFEGSIGIGYRL